MSTLNPNFIRLKLLICKPFEDGSTYLLAVEKYDGQMGQPFYVPSAWLVEHGGYYEETQPVPSPPPTEEQRRAAFVQETLAELTKSVKQVPTIVPPPAPASPPTTTYAHVAQDLGLRVSSGLGVLNQILKINEEAGPDSAAITMAQARQLQAIIDDERAPAPVRGAAFERIVGIPLKDLYRIRPGLTEHTARRIALQRAAAFGSDGPTGLGSGYIPADWAIFIRSTSPLEEFSEFAQALDVEPPASRPAAVDAGLEKFNQSITGIVPATEEEVMRRAQEFTARSSLPTKDD